MLEAYSRVLESRVATMQQMALEVLRAGGAAALADGSAGQPPGGECAADDADGSAVAAGISQSVGELLLTLSLIHI